MFKDYEIKFINNEEVLYLHLDLNTEFASFNRKSKTTLNEEINSYINDKKIKFKGKKIVLLASGLIIGTLLYTAPLLNKENNMPNYNYTQKVLVLKEDLPIPNINVNNNINQIKEDKNTSIKQEINKDTQNTEVNSNKLNSNQYNNNNTINSQTNTNKVENHNQTTIQDIIKNENLTDNKTKNKEKTQIDTSTYEVVKQMVTIKRSNGTILYMEMEEYLIGVVAAEMPASFHIEALKAQAIAARTYTLKAIQDNIILTDTVKTQVYKDNNELRQIWGNSFNTYYNKVKKAVLSTEGLAMYYNNNLINAFYHSTSNGYTEDSTQVFGSYPYLKSVESSVDINVSSYLRTNTFTYEDISNKLDIPVTSLSEISLERNTTKRVSKIIIDNNTYDGVKFRNILGLRSTDFDITLNENNITITTRGYGHGVGMSQYGANEYAKKGMSYQNILKHYYTGITIKSF